MTTTTELGATIKLQAIGNGNVLLTHEGHDGFGYFTTTTEYSTDGQHVMRVYPNGTESPAFEGLQNSGYFLRCADGDVMAAIRKTLGMVA